MMSRWLVGPFLAALAVALLAPAATAAAPTVLLASLSGSSEVPPVTTAASGEAWLVVSADGTAIDYTVTYSGLSGTLAAAHIHLGAAGTNGGILFPLAAGPSPMVGRLTAADLTPTGGITTFTAALEAIRAGNTYVNLHTAANPAGEIRGQLQPVSGALVATAALSGGAEVPPVSTGASGNALIVATGDTIRYTVTYSGLSGTLAAAHIHLGAAGTNGGILFPLAAGPSPMVGRLTAADLTPTGGITTFAAALEAIRAGNTYVNLHTAANPAGEIRGQLQPVSGALATPPPRPTTAPTPPATATTGPLGAAPAFPLVVLLTVGLVLAISLVLRPARRRH
jgi:hypothetical protein